MQETIYKDLDGAITNLQEYFSGETYKEVHNQMNQRFQTLAEWGHTLVRRVKIGRNDLCPCGSNLKFKKCCIDKVKEDLQ